MRTSVSDQRGALDALLSGAAAFNRRRSAEVAELPASDAARDAVAVADDTEGRASGASYDLRVYCDWFSDSRLCLVEAGSERKR